MGFDNILISGAGALGALYGHKFLSAGKNTRFLAAGKRKTKLEQNGFTVNGKHFELKCTAPDDIIFKPDLILIAVKYHNLPDLIREIKHFVSRETVIISVMNGIDSEEIIRKSINTGKILSSTALGMDAVREDNVINYTKEGKLFFNHFDSSTTERDIEEVRILFEECGIAHEIPADIRYLMWFKFMINTGINQVSSILNANYRVMQTNPYAREVMDKTMLEVIAVANAEGVNLSEEDLIKWYKVLDSLGGEGKTSMCQDIEAGRKSEVEMLSGKMIELGQKHNVDVTINRVLYNLIKAKENI